MRIALTIVMCSWVFAGCLARDPDQPDLERHENFVGIWAIEHEIRGELEASIYEFTADGEIRHLETMTTAARPDDFVTGSVWDPQSDVRCEFASTWYSLDTRTLAVDSDCSDGAFREVFVDVPLSPADSDATIVSVEDENGWRHEGSWRWRRCDSADSCF